VSKNFKNHVIKHYFKNLKTLLLSDLIIKEGVPTHSPPKENCHDCVLDVLNQELQKSNQRIKKLFSKSRILQTAWLETMSDFSSYQSKKDSN